MLKYNLQNIYSDLYIFKQFFFFVNRHLTFPWNFISLQGIISERGTGAEPYKIVYQIGSGCIIKGFFGILTK